MSTEYLIMRAHGPSEKRLIDWPRQPGYDRVRELIEPLLDGASLEQVSCLADFQGGSNYQPSDMFVDDRGRDKRLLRNEPATVIYRRASLLRMQSRDPESLPAIHGTAILFNRRIWF